MSSEGVGSRRLHAQEPFPQEPSFSPAREEVSGHQFSLQTKRFETEVVASAVEKAAEHAAKGTRLAHVTANLICKEAHAEFKRKMEETFAASVSDDLMILTLQSRETLFFVTLRERVIDVIKTGKTAS